MPPKASPKPVTPAELLNTNSAILSLANRMLVNRQATAEEYRSLVSAANIFIDKYLSMADGTPASVPATK